MSLSDVRPIPGRIQGSPLGSTSVLALAAMETRSGVRGVGFRFVAGVALIIGLAVGGAPGTGVSLSAWALSEAAWRYMSFVVVVWMSLSAVQDAVTRADILVYSKPQPTERLVMSRFLGAYAQLLLALTFMYAGGIVSRACSGGGLGGFLLYGSRYAVSASVLFFVASASYSLALLARTPLAGGIVGLFCLMTLAGKSFLATAYFPAYSQNLPTYVLLGTSLLCLACTFYRRQRRGSARPALWARVVAPLALVLSIVALRYNLQTGHDPLARLQPGLEMMSEQNATLGEKAPGFWLPDASGKLTSLGEYPGRILVIALWSPNEAESAFVLSRLEDIRAKFGARRVQPVAICLSEDTNAASAFGYGEGAHFPVVQDWGTHNADKPGEVSPMAIAYQVKSLPLVVITDRRRNTRAVLSGIDAYNGTMLDAELQARVRIEPE